MKKIFASLVTLALFCCFTVSVNAAVDNMEEIGGSMPGSGKDRIIRFVLTEVIPQSDSQGIINIPLNSDYWMPSDVTSKGQGLTITRENGDVEFYSLEDIFQVMATKSFNWTIGAYGISWGSSIFTLNKG